MPDSINPSTFRRDIIDVVHEMKSRGDIFAIATVVKTLSVTAAKPGAKAIIDAQGNTIEGWIGGGCAQYAVKMAAINAIADGQSRHVSITPEELMQDQIAEDDAADSQHVHARNMCPSKGSMEIFVEPMLSSPVLLVMGSSPVAQALGELGTLFDLDVQMLGSGATPKTNPLPYRVIDTPEQLSAEHPHRYIVVATQGSDDLNTLEAASALQSRHIAFVGSSRKIGYLKAKLTERGISEERLLCIESPAGLNINAVTPQEIALSILADIIRRRRA